MWPPDPRTTRRCVWPPTFLGGEGPRRGCRMKRRRRADIIRMVETKREIARKERMRNGDIL